jgi:hypothetical protein
MGLEFRRYVVGADALTTLLYLVSSRPQGQAKNEMKAYPHMAHKLCCSLNEYTRLVDLLQFIYIYIYLLSARHHHDSVFLLLLENKISRLI